MTNEWWEMWTSLQWISSNRNNAPPPPLPYDAEAGQFTVLLSAFWFYYRAPQPKGQSLRGDKNRTEHPDWMGRWKTRLSINVLTLSLPGGLKYRELENYSWFRAFDSRLDCLPRTHGLAPASVIARLRNCPSQFWSSAIFLREHPPSIRAEPLAASGPAPPAPARRRPAVRIPAHRSRGVNVPHGSVGDRRHGRRWSGLSGLRYLKGSSGPRMGGGWEGAVRGWLRNHWERGGLIHV